MTPEAAKTATATPKSAIKINPISANPLCSRITRPCQASSQSYRSKTPVVRGVQVPAVTRKHGATRWQVYDWRRRLRQVRDNWVLPKCIAPMFAPLMVEAGPRPHERRDLRLAQ
jgi:hypothetical protein